LLSDDLGATLEVPFAIAVRRLPSQTSYLEMKNAWPGPKVGLPAQALMIVILL
jgi:hypothetical protein